MTRKAANPKNLFTVFREISTLDGQPFADALRWLNEQTGLNTSNSRYGQYERGDVQPKAASINLILAAVLKSKLTSGGFDAKKISEVIQSCLLPEKTEKKPARKRRATSGNPKKRA